MLFAGWETDPKPANNIFIFFPAVILVLPITNGFCLRNFIIESVYSPSTNDW